MPITTLFSRSLPATPSLTARMGDCVVTATTPFVKGVQSAVRDVSDIAQTSFSALAQALRPDRPYLPAIAALLAARCAYTQCPSKNPTTAKVVGFLTGTAAFGVLYGALLYNTQGE